MLAIKQKATLNFLYDKHADKVLGFIISQNYSRSEGEDLLIKVFAEVWRKIPAFNAASQKDHLLMIIKIAAKFMHKDHRLNLTKLPLKKGLKLVSRSRIVALFSPLEIKVLEIEAKISKW